MTKEERHLANKIRTFEDMVLRSKSIFEIESIRNELTKMRINLQNMRYKAERERTE